MKSIFYICTQLRCFVNRLYFVSTIKDMYRHDANVIKYTAILSYRIGAPVVTVAALLNSHQAPFLVNVLDCIVNQNSILYDT